MIFRRVMHFTNNHVNVWMYHRDGCVEVLKLCEGILRRVSLGRVGVGNDYPSYWDYPKSVVKVGESKGDLQKKRTPANH